MPSSPILMTTDPFPLPKDSPTAMRLQNSTVAHAKGIIPTINTYTIVLFDKASSGADASDRIIFDENQGMMEVAVNDSVIVVRRGLISSMDESIDIDVERRPLGMTDKFFVTEPIQGRELKLKHSQKPIAKQSAKLQ